MSRRAMRVTIEISVLKLTLWILGLVGFFWVPGYNMTHPMQRVGDDWYGPYLFFAGSALLIGLTIESIYRWIRRRRAPTQPVSTHT